MKLALNATFFGQQLGVDNDLLLALLMVAEVLVIVIFVVILICILGHTAKKKREDAFFETLPEEEPAEFSAEPFMTRPASQNNVAPYAYGNGANGVNGGGANRQGQPRGPIVLPPIVLGLPNLRVAPPIVQDPRNTPVPPQTQQHTSPADSESPQE